MVGIFNILEREQMKNDNAVEQLKELDRRLGVGVGAVKERTKLHNLIVTTAQQPKNAHKPKKEGNSKNQNLKGKKSKEEKEGK